MAGWEMALVIVAVTFMIVNIVNTMMTVALLVDMKGFIKKGYKLLEKVIDKSDKFVDQMFEDFKD
jgi:hypothetical protein